MYLQLTRLLSLIFALQTTSTQAAPIVALLGILDPAPAPKNQSHSANAGQSNDPAIQYSHNWSGAVLNAPPTQGDAFKNVSALIAVPHVSRSETEDASYQAASAWVGIDGATAADAILQTGIDVGIQNGEPYYNAWYQWFPTASTTFTDFEVNAGDVLLACVRATSKTSGECVIENKSTGATASKSISAPQPTSTLAGQNAEWIVEDFISNSKPVPLVDFGKVSFDECAAHTKQGSNVGVTGATPYEIVQDDKSVTVVEVANERKMTVTHT